MAQASSARAVASGTSKDLGEFLSTEGVPAWGTVEAAGLHPLTAGFRRVLVLVFPYRLGGAQYDEEAYFEASTGNKAWIARTTAALGAWLDSRGVAWLKPQGTDPLAGPFPIKSAAAQAGLGWIGKSGLLVTRGWGPRVRLEALLLDEELPTTGPALPNRCADCRACVDACPNQCFDGHGGVFRVEACRLGHPELPGKDRRFNCGMCVHACPWGRMS